jgi:hypothetical protein
MSEDPEADERCTPDTNDDHLIAPASVGADAFVTPMGRCAG